MKRMGETQDCAPARVRPARTDGICARLGVALLVPAIAIVLHELGHYLSHLAFGYSNVSLSFSEVSIGPAPSDVNARLADGVSFAAGTAISLSLALVALSKRIPSALAAALAGFELLRAGLGVGIGISSKGVRALWGGVGELRYLATAFEWPSTAGALLGFLEIGVPVVAVSLLVRRLPTGQRMRVVAPAVAGSIVGLALWLLVIGPVLLP